ncbi:Ig-like domain-containing protein [Xenorhabdus bovienii]|uniref:Ig-like domain-containing protein n=1 Tax=Xenorhabdus bovienii TaxID=40576 RepID=UPI0023B33A55|nr:Ig-like domain-containing protein [Xenorhabdus bovienii]MDE9519751.1 Ig-like domain-containing protein [Xenorhabdus bovienii]
MKTKSIKYISDCHYSLMWIDPKKEQIVGEILEETLFLGSTSCVTTDMDVKFVLDNPNVAFETEKGKNGLQEWSTKTDSLSQLYVRIYSVTNTPCNFRLTASLIGYPEIIAEPLSLEFKPNTVDQIILEIKNNNAEANGSATDKVTATAKDRNGHPIEGAIIDFSANRGAKVKQDSGKTNDIGEADVFVTSTIDGEINVQARDRQNGKENEISIHFKKYYYSDCHYSLMWIDPKKEQIVGEILEETLFLGATSCITMDMDVKFVLDNPNVAFETEKGKNGLQEWSTKTDSLGLSSIYIYSVTNTPCNFRLTASLIGYPEIIAEPLLLEFKPNAVDKI